MKVESESEIEVVQLCPTLSDLMDCSLPGSSIPGIFQAIILVWVAIAFSIYELIFYYLYNIFGILLEFSSVTTGIFHRRRLTLGQVTK